MGSSLWLLEAKRHATEDRSSQACSVKFWLKPGAVVVGRQGQAELPVGEDKSISRKHADITVPTAEDWQREEGGQPYVLLKGAPPPSPPPPAAARCGRQSPLSPRLTCCGSFHYSPPYRPQQVRHLGVAHEHLCRQRAAGRRGGARATQLHGPLWLQVALQAVPSGKPGGRGWGWVAGAGTGQAWPRVPSLHDPFLL